MILGAAEVDLNFDVNVTTGTSGMIIGGSGGHSDTAAGAKLALVTTRLTGGAYPKIVDRVATITTPGETIDAVVTEEGVESIRAAPISVTGSCPPGFPWFRSISCGRLRSDVLALLGKGPRHRAIGLSPWSSIGTVR